MEALDLQQVTFDYTSVAPETALDLRMAAERIRMRLKRSAEDIIAIGQDLHAAKARLPHGKFQEWLAAEFDMSYPTAVNFMRVAERFGGKSINFVDLPVSAIYALAAPSTSDAIVERVTSGEIAPNVAAIREAKEAEARAKAETEQVKAQAQDAQRRLFDAQSEASQARAQIDATTSQLTRLQRELDALRNAPQPEPEIREVVKEVKVEVTPQRVKDQITALEQRINEVTRQKDMLQKRAVELEKQAQAEAQKRVVGEDSRRVRLKWYTTRTTLAAAIRKAMGDLPLATDTQAFEADDWQGLAEVQALAQRLIGELSGLYNATDAIVDAQDVQNFVDATADSDLWNRE